MIVSQAWLTISVKQIAARLYLGTPGSASVCPLAAWNKLRQFPLTRAALSARGAQKQFPISDGEVLVLC